MTRDLIYLTATTLTINHQVKPRRQLYPTCATFHQLYLKPFPPLRTKKVKLRRFNVHVQFNLRVGVTKARGKENTVETQRMHEDIVEPDDGRVS